MAEDDEDQVAIDEAKRKLVEFGPKPAYESAQICESIGDPLKDSVSPTMSIVMKEVAMISVVLVPFFSSVRGGYGSIGCSLNRACDTAEYPMEGFDILLVSIFSIFLAILITIRIRFMLAKSKGKNMELSDGDHAITTPLIEGNEEKENYGVSEARGRDSRARGI